jgi:dsDNA-specific endonuclease/ATPase MutS2
MKFKEGDRVAFLNEVGGGIVRGYDDDGLVVVEDADGFELPYPEEELVKEVKWTPPGISVQGSGVVPSPKKTNQSFGYRMIGEKKPYMEVDLHIHMIADSTRNLSNHDMVLLQLDHFERTLAEARRMRLSKVVYIHGIGKGRLRDELRKRLKTLSNCEFDDADYRVYGLGATQVKLWYNYYEGCTLSVAPSYEHD